MMMVMLMMTMTMTLLSIVQLQLRDLLSRGGLEGSARELVEAAAVEERVQTAIDAFPKTYWRIKLAILLVAERMKGPRSFWCVIIIIITVVSVAMGLSKVTVT
jgi:hypothetical protein